MLFYHGSSQTNISYKWKNCYGGSGPDNAYCVQQAANGGYIVAGYSDSRDGEVSNNHGSTDYWVTSIDNSGVIQWENSYGGSIFDIAYYIALTSDGGYIIAGSSNSNDGDVTNNHGSDDCWVVKIDETGAIQWSKSFGGTGIDYANCIQQTNDGGFIIAGFTMSNDGDITNNHGAGDAWIIKINSIGTIQWQRCYGGSNEENVKSIQQTTDGGYIFSGSTGSEDGDVSSNHGGGDAWVVKINALGAIQWQRCYGGSKSEDAASIQQTVDGGYIVACTTTGSEDGDVTGIRGKEDAWIVKINDTGNLQWQKCYGGSSMDFAYSIRQTADNGFIIANTSWSDDGDLTGNNGYSDFWVLKTDQSGTFQWSENYGGSGRDDANCVLQSSDGSYIIAGSAGSEDGDVTGNHGPNDFWILDLCVTDSVFISISTQSYCHSTTLTATGGFAEYLWSDGQTAQSIEITEGGFYSVIAKNSSGCISNADIIVSDAILPYSEEQICMVTLDELTGKNTIVIEKPMNVGTDSILIYRLNNLSSEYLPIGSIGINDNSVYVDEDAIPEKQSYQYSISVKDTCGNESKLSETHRTILLQSSIGVNKEVNLNWNPYEGFTYPNFEIYRRTDNNFFTLIANVPNNTYAFTDLTPPSGSNRYQIRVSSGNSCYPLKSSYSYVTSNIIELSTIGICENPTSNFSVLTNPVTDLLTLKCNADLLGSDYIIAELNGKALLYGKLTLEEMNINVSQLTSGMYLLRIGGYNASVVKIVKK